ncbi:monofunctional riboflavin biosynthesis protein RIBA 3, chloroplastic [Malania oleifera]|uniref:monofunctional riboflavin biosynthesis protein RIBA 3, chloroplastic n=1 Tax=Malania oleifera TaxID=397392 RepID=UPI0025AE5C6B|nr:monofunctional riboflavin biosynthesis protein RIBA 3, chloroplastic [Malania oleifera]
MDCVIFPRLFVTSSSHRHFPTQSIGIRFGLYKQRCFDSTSWALGVSRIGAGNVFDESFLKENGNGSLSGAFDHDSAPLLKSLNGNDNGSLLGGFDESVSARFRAVDAEITPETIDFFVSDAEGDPDCPSEGFSSIEQALNALLLGKFVIVVDDENGDTEGNLVMAASFASPQAMAFLVKHGSGIVSVGMKEEDLERLNLPLMSPENEDEDSSAPSFTITVDAKACTSTGVSAADRAKTVLALSSPWSKPEDFRRPGHVFPLKYRNGGVLRRAGHTEASVDLVALAGLHPVSVLSAVVDADDGSMASLPDLRKLSLEHGILVISITDLIRYRRKREKLVERSVVSRLPTKWCLFQAYCYRSKLDGTEHFAIVKGSIGNGQDVLVRVHSECLTGDVFGSARCDCGNQLDLAMLLIEQAGRGVVVYLRGHEGRGIGLGHKLRAYNLQDQGHDTVEANIELGLAVDAREYGIAAQILRDIGVRTMHLMTNNPAKLTGLKGYGLAVVGRVPVLAPITDENKRYLETKRTKMGHVYGSDIRGPLDGFINPNTKNIHSQEEEQ